MNKIVKLMTAFAFAAIAHTLFAYNGGYENSLDYLKYPGVGYANNELTAREESGMTIGANRYAQCKKLASVDLAGVTSIGDAAFAYSALESVTIPSSVQSMGYIAFGGCANLKSVTVSGLGWVDPQKEPFAGCGSLSRLVAQCAAPNGWSSETFQQVFPAVKTVQCPQEYVSGWSAIAPSVVTGYSLTYTLDGGYFAAEAPTTVGASDAACIPAPVKPGYVFLGWSAGSAISGNAMYSADGSYYQPWNGTSLIGADIPGCWIYSLAASGSVNLVANWRNEWEYLVTYDLDGGTMGYAPSRVMLGEWFGMTPPTKAGYVFAGWQIVAGLNPDTAYASVKDGEIIYAKSDKQLYGGNSNWTSFFSLSTTGAVTLKACWRTEWQYLISYELDGGTMGYAPSSAMMGEWFGMEPPTKDGAVFAGWQVVAGLDPTIAYGSVKDGEIIYVDSDKIPYGGGSAWTSFYSLTSTGSVTLRAVWTDPNTYRIIYDLNGGTAGGFASEVVAIDEWGCVLPPTKPGYVFSGWQIVRGLDAATAWGNDGGETYALSAEGMVVGGGAAQFQFYGLSSTGSVTLKACWRADPWEYSVFYDLDGGTPGFYAATTARCGEFAGVAAPTKDGYVFAGWTVVTGLAADYVAIGSVQDGVHYYITSSTQLNGAGYDWFSFYSLSTTGAVTLKANWTPAALSMVRSAATDDVAVKSSASGAAGGIDLGLKPGYYTGELADGSGVYELLIDSVDANQVGVGCLRVVTGETVEFYDDVLITGNAKQFFVLKGAAGFEAL